MSKEAALRAMREARYTARNAGPAAPARPAKPTARRGPLAAVPDDATPDDATSVGATSVDAAPATDELCGHRSMNVRTCTREHGHAAKSHRYS